MSTSLLIHILQFALAINISNADAATIIHESKQYKFDPLLTSAIVYKESQFQNVLCYMGAHGLMQVQVPVHNCGKHSYYLAEAMNLYSIRGNLKEGLRLAQYWKQWCKRNNHMHHWLLHFNQGFGHCNLPAKRCKYKDREVITTGIRGGYPQRVLYIYNKLKRAKRLIKMGIV